MSAVRILICALLIALPVCAQRAQGPPPKTDCEASGTVVNAINGEPIARAMVSTTSGGAATDAKGEWSVTGQICERWMPTASRPGFIEVARDNKSVEFVSGSPARGIKIALTPEASISGHVQDTDGDPIENAQVMLMRVRIQNGHSGMAMDQSISTDQSGDFSIGRVQPGRYVICGQSRQSTFPPDGGSPLIYVDDCYPGPLSDGQSVAAQVEGGTEIHVSLTLRATAGLHVRGTVSGIREGQQPAVWLQKIQNEDAGRGDMFLQMGPAVGPPAPVARGGTFDIANVIPGVYMARAQLQSDRVGDLPASANQRIQVGGSDLEGVQLRLEPAGSINGTVRYELSGATPPATADPARNPNPNEKLNINLKPITSSAGGPYGQIKWDENNLRFSWPQVAAGEYTLSTFAKPGTYVKSATLRGQDVLTQPFSISGATGPIEIVVSDDTGTFNVTVTDADDHPASATIILKPATGQPITVRSGDDGVATRKGLPVGDYRVWAFDDISNVPWAEEQWMMQHAGPPTRITITQTGTGNVTLKRVIVP